MRLVALAAALGGIGTTLVLAELSWFHRLPLVERMRPFSPGGRRRAAVSAGRSPTLRELAAPLAGSIGDRLSRQLGVSDDLTTRLHRVHSTDDVTAFRIRQVGWATGGLVVGVAAALVLSLPALIALLVVFALPSLGFLLPEHRLTAASDDHRRRLTLELPVLTEQLGMLLSSGYSITGALTRIAERSSGVGALDIRRILRRVRHGVSPTDALREWAQTVDLPAVHQLVGVLALHRETNDLGRLISNEARAMRRDLHRELLARIEKRSQQVWIPVTVAALVPGVIFLAIPFVSALRSFASL
jgi:Flp pilus assembly protein TadB